MGLMDSLKSAVGGGQKNDNNNEFSWGTRRNK